MRPLQDAIAAAPRAPVSPAGRLEGVKQRFTTRDLRRERATERAVDISVVVPVFNERENLPGLVERVTAALETTKRSYELIFIDDHSDDQSALYLLSLRDNRHVRVFMKEGDRGKSSALMQGFRH